MTREQQQIASHAQQAEEHFRNPPRLSVIVCTYNRCRMLLTTLDSLCKQTLTPKQFEVIVVDNGSDDGTEQAVQAYTRASRQQEERASTSLHIHYLLEPENGLAYARNAGIRVARGEILVFLDDDTIVDMRFLEHLLSAYEETQADAIGGCVELRWEAPRPYWLTNDLLDLLGHFVPSRTRMPLPEPLSFSSCSFSILRRALHSIGGFTPYFSRRLNVPLNREIHELCQRLRKAGYTLWYEPAAIALHRVSRARLERAFLVGRAYWHGRSEILEYCNELRQSSPQRTLWYDLKEFWPDLRALLHIALIQRPLLHLARQPASEQVTMAMAQAHLWGRLCQRALLVNRAPALIDKPDVLLIRAAEGDALWLMRGLQAQGVRCITSCGEIPLDWLWQHRAQNGRASGIIHCYQPGALHLTYWQRQRLLRRLWQAQQLGICIVSSDVGGWWQSTRNLHFLAQRTFERQLLKGSHIVLTYARNPTQLYIDKKVQKRVHSVPHPGLYGTLGPHLPRMHARQELGLSAHGFVYLCLVYQHIEREVLHLITAYTELCTQVDIEAQPQLLLVGTPQDRRHGQKLVECAALNSSIHLYLEERPELFPCYVAAVNAVVLPHFAIDTAGSVETALLFYSYERVVIFPQLPRFQGMLPAHAGVAYDPASRTALVDALRRAQTREYQHYEHEAAELDAEKGWQRYAQRLVALYKPLLNPRSSMRRDT